MLRLFNQNMYDHKRRREATKPGVAQQEEGEMEGEEEDMIQLLNDVEELFGEPVFLTA